MDIKAEASHFFELTYIEEDRALSVVDDLSVVDIEAKASRSFCFMAAKELMYVEIDILMRM